jgi:hypothetical protein
LFEPNREQVRGFSSTELFTATASLSTPQIVTPLTFPVAGTSNVTVIVTKNND